MTQRDSRLQLRVGLFVLTAMVLFAGFVLVVSSRSRWLEDRRRWR